MNGVFMTKLLPLLLLCTNSFAMTKLHYDDIICVNDDFYGKMECKVKEKDNILGLVYKADCRLIRKDIITAYLNNINIDRSVNFKLGQCSD